MESRAQWGNGPGREPLRSIQARDLLKNASPPLSIGAAPAKVRVPQSPKLVPTRRADSIHQWSMGTVLMPFATFSIGTATQLSSREATM